MAKTLVIDAQRIGIACAAVAPATIVSTLLIHAGWENSRIERLTIHRIHNAIVVIVLIQTVGESRSIGVGETFVDLAITVVIHIVADFFREFVRIVTKKPSGDTYLLALFAKVCIIPIARLIEVRLILTIYGGGIAVIVLAIAEFDVEIVWIVTHHDRTHTRVDAFLAKICIIPIARKTERRFV